jgi:acid phosphatase
MALALAFSLASAACGESDRSDDTNATTTSSSRAHTSSTPRDREARTTSTLPSGRACTGTGRAPSSYRAVVVFSFENRTWDQVGAQFSKMPYLHQLATQCATFTDWTETDTKQSSLTQYVGQVTGARQSGTVDDCTPSASCSTTADSIFRQARVAGRRAVNYVEGATTGCSAEGNAAKHVPALYLWGADDREHCEEQVRPYSEFDPEAPAAFAFITPTQCNDGHDCSNAVVDEWAATNIQRVLDSTAYRAGEVVVFVWYDEDHPVPNLWIAPTAVAGATDLAAAGYAGTLAAWESMLDLPCLANACDAPDMRAAAHM